MRFNIHLKTPPHSSERVDEVLKDFDMTFDQSSESFEGDIDIDGKDWSVGLIVGSSGSDRKSVV